MSIEWFFQLPGLFITGGVFLIIVALIVFLIGSGKARSELSKDAQDMPIDEPKVTAEETTINNGVIDTNGRLELNSTGNATINSPVEPIEPIKVSAVTQVSADPVQPTEVAPVKVEPVTPVQPIEVAPVTIEPVTPVQPIEVAPVTIEPVTPVQPIEVAPVTIEPVTPVQPTEVAPVTSNTIHNNEVEEI